LNSKQLEKQNLKLIMRMKSKNKDYLLKTVKLLINAMILENRYQVTKQKFMKSYFFLKILSVNKLLSKSFGLSLYINSRT
jgi:hypothetical protein